MVKVECLPSMFFGKVNLVITTTRAEINDERDVAEEHDRWKDGNFGQCVLIVCRTDNLQFRLLVRSQFGDLRFVEGLIGESELGFLFRSHLCVNSAILTRQSLVEIVILNGPQ